MTFHSTFRVQRTGQSAGWTGHWHSWLDWLLAWLRCRIWVSLHICERKSPERDHHVFVPSVLFNRQMSLSLAWIKVRLLSCQYVRYWLRSCWEFQLLAVKQWTVSWVFKTWHDFFELAGRDGEYMMLHYNTTARVWTAYEGSWIDDPDAGLARTSGPGSKCLGLRRISLERNDQTGKWMKMPVPRPRGTRCLSLTGRVHWVARRGTSCVWGRWQCTEWMNEWMKI